MVLTSRYSCEEVDGAALIRVASCSSFRKQQVNPQYRFHSTGYSESPSLAHLKMLGYAQNSPLPLLARFLHDAAHPATSWLLWAQSPELSSSSSSCHANDFMSTAPYRSTSVRGMMHHAVSFGTKFSDPCAGESRPSTDNLLPADILYVCQHELCCESSPEVKISLGCFFGGMPQVHALTKDVSEFSPVVSRVSGFNSRAQADLAAHHGKSESSKETLLCIGHQEGNTTEQNSMSHSLSHARVPVGGRFAAFMGPDGVVLMSLVRLNRNFIAMQLFYPHGCIHAPQIDGAQINSSAHVLHDPSGMCNGALATTCELYSESFTLLHDECPVCDMPLESCPCDTAQQFGSQCDSFRLLSERLQDGTGSWRRNSGRAEVVQTVPATRRFGGDGNFRIHVPIYLDLRDGFSSNSRTSNLRLRFFEQSGMSISSPYLLPPTFELPNDVHEAREYQCSLCPKKFRLQAGLRRHKRTVHGPRRYECPECRARFQQATHLQTHRILIHLKTLDHVCELCGMKFPIRARLSSHVKNVH